MRDIFADSDSFIQHIADTASNIEDDYVTSRYVGFVAVSAVTVYELAVKKIFFDFAKSRHSILHSFVEHYFRRVNGKITLDDLKDDYLPRFGAQYKDSFKEILDEKENMNLRSQGGSISSSYGSIIAWRNKFVHAGEIPNNASLSEAIKSYGLGKEVIFSLHKVFEQAAAKDA